MGLDLTISDIETRTVVALRSLTYSMSTRSSTLLARSIIVSECTSSNGIAKSVTWTTPARYNPSVGLELCCRSTKISVAIARQSSFCSRPVRRHPSLSRENGASGAGMACRGCAEVHGISAKWRTESIPASLIWSE